MGLAPHMTEILGIARETSCFDRWDTCIVNPEGSRTLPPTIKGSPYIKGCIVLIEYG